MHFQKTAAVSVLGIGAAMALAVSVHAEKPSGPKTPSQGSRASAGAAQGGVAGASIPEMNTVLMATGLSNPLYLTAPQGDYKRAFIVEQRSGTTGRIRILDLTTNPPTLQSTASPFLTISPVSTGDEQGLLGLAFDPNYMTNGRFYIDYTNPNTHLIRCTDTDPTDNVFTGTMEEILTVTQPQSNHNGGWLAFGPDGYLYETFGDGGNGGDTGSGHNASTGNGQDTNTLLGKMLRLDVSGATGYAIPPGNPFVGTAGLDEIWAYGLRNSWRPAFDSLTGDLYIADVGQDTWEELDLQPANSSETVGAPGYQGGLNYGWRCYEGNATYNTNGGTCPPIASTARPFYVYAHGGTPFLCSITGGFIYRGTAISGLQGYYMFADYNCNFNTTSPIWTLRITAYGNPATYTDFVDRTTELQPSAGGNINQITSFGLDNAGEPYVMDRDGRVFKIVPENPPANDACANATAITDGTYPTSNVSATADAPVEVIACGSGNVTTAGADVWYKYTAGCNGTAMVDLCNTTYDATLVVYNGCVAGTGQSIACADSGSCDRGASLSFPVTAGHSYRIRVGGVNQTQGTGSLTVSCHSACAADIAPSGGDGQVNIDDLTQIILNWGTNNASADINNDGNVNIDDLTAVILSWGACP
ncbi:MAG TPA: PQQ-dependent sugar dehydrogenase [Phycisphaerales bacterium]|nr:PQQ-dependent sugar dehydrogenase [Phycisphaerales bacterium]